MTSSNVVAANGIVDATSWVSDDCKSPFAAGSSEIGLPYGKSDLDCGGATGFDPPNGEKDFFMAVPTDAEPPPMELRYDPFDAAAATVDDCCGCGCDCGDGTAGGGITLSLLLLTLKPLTSMVSWMSDDCKSPLAVGPEYKNSCLGATGFDPPNGLYDFLTCPVVDDDDDAIDDCCC
jgi:hypothetical protein